LIDSIVDSGELKKELFWDGEVEKDIETVDCEIVDEAEKVDKEGERCAD
jgi:hypothetical protein